MGLPYDTNSAPLFKIQCSRFVLLLMLGIASTLSSCVKQEEGPAERMGRSIDRIAGGIYDIQADENAKRKEELAGQKIELDRRERELRERERELDQREDELRERERPAYRHSYRDDEGYR